MSDERLDLTPPKLPRVTQRWPTGLTTLIGVVVGAFVGLLIDFVPVGMGAGVALGVGIDSVMSNLLNGQWQPGDIIPRRHREHP